MLQSNHRSNSSHWSFIFSGVYFERSGKCRLGTRPWISEYYFERWRQWMWDKHVAVCLSHIYLSIFQRDHLKIAQQFFQLVGGSASECGTVRENWRVLERNNVQGWFVTFLLSCRHYSWQTVHGLLLFPLETVWRCSHISQLNQG